MEKKAIRYKWILYILLMFVAIVLETTVLPYVKIFGAAPMHLLPYTVATIAMLEGTTSGALAGLCAGILSDCLLPIADGFYTIIFVFCGILISFLNMFVFWKSYWVTLLYLAVTVILVRFVYYIFFFVLFGNAGILSVFATLPAEFFTTALFTPIMYFLIVKIAKRTGLNEEA